MRFSSLLLDEIQKGQSLTRHRIGFKKNVLKIDEKFLDMPCTDCGQPGHLTNVCKKKNMAIKNNLTYLKRTYGKKIRKIISKNKHIPRWTMKDLIHPFTHKQGPKWI